ncbi:glycosyltransferase family 4 protein [Lacticaseibacillus zhaodongensis]|uniref:glycosyltransferase family 4 protein n=1 Tax=Lacticaseibacillus zhaodongensis TaxID=2668065 RepID=UPI0012D2E88F|nr:MraY family glycosyltransferase [Lacticaseibacillus zhaodongensis]
MPLFKIVVSLVVTMFISAVITPFVRRLAFVLGAVDKPNARRVNTKPMPTMGGLAIFLAFTFATFVLLRPQFNTHMLFSLFGAEAVVIITGMIDDIKELTPKQKMLGLIIAALVVYFLAGVRMTEVNLGFIHFELGWLSLPITLLWIVGITNAVNLIDGLDGLATGVSIISLSTMGIIGFFFLTTAEVGTPIMIFTLVAALIGFLPHNFHPAKIFLGDTGSLFIGFMLSVLSLQGLKNVTFISLIIPIIALGVPITDTLFAIIRRLLNRVPITQADKHHLHHRLMQMGLTHRQTVLVIYGIELIFSMIALLYPLSSVLGNILLTVGVVFGLELFVELIGLLGPNRTPMLYLIKHTVRKLSREGELVQNKTDDKQSKH